MDEYKLRKAIEQSSRAKALLEDETLKDAFHALAEGYILAWRTTHIEDVVGREKLFLAINVVGKVQEHLASIVSNGTLAQREIDEIARAGERKKRFGVI